MSKTHLTKKYTDTISGSTYYSSDTKKDSQDYYTRKTESEKVKNLDVFRDMYTTKKTRFSKINYA